MCLLTYHFPDNFTPEVKSHGNSKRDNPFFPTWPSTAKLLQQECGKSGPKKAISNVSTLVGGITKAKCPGQLPRNERQAIYLNRGKNPADELYEVMFRAKQEDSNEKFIRAVKVIPDPAIVLATDSQINDLVRFSTNSQNFCIVTIDPTFSLGEFDVTPITYRNLLFESRRTGNPPICIGPVLIHYRKSYETYLFFASTLVGMNRELEKVQAFGTDGEKALGDAFHHEFSKGAHLLCSIHFRRNIKQKLADMNISEPTRSDLLVQVCGSQQGDTRYEGLLDALNSSDYDMKLKLLREKWKTSEAASHFIDWLDKYKSGDMKRSMIGDVRSSAGLGLPPNQFTTNASESLNALIKAGVSYKRSELSVFVDKLRGLVKEQDSELERAVIGRGKYRLSAPYTHCELSEREWFSMNASQRLSHLKKVSEMPVAVPYKEPTELQLSTIQPSSEEPESTSLSVSVSDIADAIAIPRNILTGIWNKATDLLATKGAIAIAPGLHSQARTVISKSRAGFHTVVPGKGGRFKCDDCPNFKSIGICAHVVAVAELNGRLSEFISCLKRSKAFPSVTKLVTSDMPASRGRKGHVASRKRPSAKSGESSITKRVDMLASSEAGNSDEGISQETLPQPVFHNISANSYTQSGNTYNSLCPVYPGHTSYPFFYQHPCSTYQCYTQSLPSFQPGPPMYSNASATNVFSGSTSDFEMVYLTKRIKKCYGCSGEFVKDSDGSVLGPPHDIAVRHADFREYFLPNGERSVTRQKQNTYYHPSLSCIVKKYPHFSTNMVNLSSIELKTEHYSLLRSTFLIT